MRVFNIEAVHCPGSVTTTVQCKHYFGGHRSGSGGIQVYTGKVLTNSARIDFHLLTNGRARQFPHPIDTTKKESDGTITNQIRVNPSGTDFFTAYVSR